MSRLKSMSEAFAAAQGVDSTRKKAIARICMLKAGDRVGWFRKAGWLGVTTETPNPPG